MTCRIPSLVFFGVLSAALTAEATIKIGYFSKEAAPAFEKRVQPQFKEFARGCDCELVNLTPYDDKGQFKAEALADKISGLPSDVAFVFFDFNERYSDKNTPIVEELGKKVNDGRLIVATAGVPMSNEGTCPLDRTLMGRVPNSLIIGELTERERLLPQCFYGPEMLSAIRPPKDLMGQGYAPLLFATRLASQWNKRKPQDWLAYLKAKKNKSKKIWPDLEDFFPR